MEIFRYRGKLEHTKEALKRGKISIGFIGGSITADTGTFHNWPEPVLAWFTERYPEVRICVENAAIGATGSELAVYRAQRDLIARGCDLVFVEFAVNDNGEEADKRMQTREGLLRKLLADGTRDVVLVYTYCQDMYTDMMGNRVPESIADFERLAVHYGLGSVWMGLYALEEVKKGRMRWEEWLPDGLHPQHRGSLSYGQSVAAYLDRELTDDAPGAGSATTRLPAPLHTGNWEGAVSLDFSAVELEGPWTIRRWPHLEWADQVLYTSAVGASLRFSFHGRVLTLGFDFGKSSAEFRYRLDGGEWIDVSRDRPDWCGNFGWYRATTLLNVPEPAGHQLELEVIHGNAPNCKGTDFVLALIGIVPE